MSADLPPELAALTQIMDGQPPEMREFVPLCPGDAACRGWQGEYRRAPHDRRARVDLRPFDFEPLGPALCHRQQRISEILQSLEHIVGSGGR